MFGSIYKPLLQNNQYFISILSNLLDFYPNEYDNKVAFGDFNRKPSSSSMLSLMDRQNFVNLIKKQDVFQRSRFLYLFDINKQKVLLQKHFFLRNWAQ